MDRPVAFQVCLADICWQITCNYEKTRLRCKDYLAPEAYQPEQTIRITPEDIEGERQLLLSKKDPGQKLEASTPEALEYLTLCRKLANRLPLANRMLFHGSGLAFDGQGVLFTAKSGTGKSTHTSLWREAFGDRVQMVNDDKPFLQLTEENAIMWGNPWRGKHGLGGNLSAPLYAICLVNRGEENRIEQISPSMALPMLLQQTFTPEDSALLLKTLELVDRLSKQVKIYSLWCNMDPEAAWVACRGMELVEKD